MRTDAPLILPFPVGGGTVGQRLRSLDWSRSTLGPMDGWPRALRTAVQIMLDSRFAMWMAWGEHLTFFCNDAYLPTLGSKQETLGYPAPQVWREVWPQVGPRIAGVLAGGSATWDEELMLVLERHGYPEETYHTFSYSPVPDDSGRVGGMLCVVTEETQRVIGQRRLNVLRDLGSRLASARVQSEVLAAFESCVAANDRDLPFALIYLLDADGRSARLAASSGLPGDSASTLQALDGGSDSPWPFATVLQRGRPERTEELPPVLAQVPLGSGAVPVHQAMVLPLVLHGQERPSGLLVAGINPLRRLDDEYRGFLELLTGQMAAGLTSARVFEEERARSEALVELDRAKTAFFSNVSHEFRTPLTLLLGPLEDLLAEPGREIAIARQPLQLMHRNARRLLKLVNTLLDFSRIEAGRWQASYEPLDLAHYTAELASSFRSAMQRAGLTFEIRCETLPQPVYVDRDMWEKVVLNLISNAFKYTLKGTVQVSLGASEDGTGAVLRVADSGVGIPADELGRVFERFHRIVGQRGRTYEGTGIGLALVQELVRLHGGAIGIESEVDAGTTVTVTLPYGMAHLPPERIVGAGDGAHAGSGAAFVEEALRWLPEQEDELPHAADLAPRASREADAPRGRVVLADDNSDMRDYLRRLLATSYEVEAVGDGEAALAAARRRRPDLVLSDVMMPGLDGFGLLAALRADPSLRDVPVLLLSARAGEEASVEGLRAGADDYLPKPFSARELLARVATNIEVARLRHETTQALQEEARRLAILNRTGAALAAELDLERLVQTVTDAGVELSGAKFGAFFYNVVNRDGKSYTLYTLSGAERSDFERFPMPRNTQVFAPTFHGTGIVRSDDIMKDRRYGQNPPYHGMPHGHLPVRSYLAAPVVARSGEVLGGLFFGHPEPGVFDERAEMIISGIAAQTSIAIDNARLFQASRHAAAELQVLNETLEERVQAEIGQRLKAEEAFRQAQKMESVGQLTGGIAHDFNNLLTVILGNIETLQRRALKGELKTSDESFGRLTGAALDGARRAATLTQRLLAFSRRQPLDPKPIDANRLVTGMSELLRRALGETIRTEVVLAGGLWQISADANQLESALLNLAVNARDAMPDGGKLTIETANTYLDETYATSHSEVTSGQYVLIAVSDSGVGMPAEVVARAFEPFFTTKEVGAGTGLGLSQVYGFVKQSGGHVKIYSEVGEGTVVKLYLPRLMGAVAVDQVAPQRQPIGGTREEIVLVVEDDESVREHSTSMLRELGYGVLEAPDGATALRVLAQHPQIRLLFTDVGLPNRMNGRQLADEARRRHPGLRVLFTTGYARNAIVHHGRLDQGLELLLKPYTFADLAAKVRKALEG